MKILIITGSGMKAGNTDQLSDAFMEGAKEAGHQVVKVFMGNMLIQGCIGCGACQKGNHQCAVDRLYAVSKEDKYPKRNVALVMTAGDDEESTFQHAVQFYHVLVDALGWNDLGTCLAGGCTGGEGERHIDEKHLQAAYGFGKNIGTV